MRSQCSTQEPLRQWTVLEVTLLDPIGTTCSTLESPQSSLGTGLYTMIEGDSGHSPLVAKVYRSYKTQVISPSNRSDA